MENYVLLSAVFVYLHTTRKSALLGICGIFFAASASAHPLGDFSINQYFVVDGTGPLLQIRYLLDVAEIPSFSELDMLDTDFNSEISQDEVDTYLAARIPQLEQFLRLQLDGEDTPLTLRRHKLLLLQGNAGMVVFNILLDLEAQAVPWPPTAPVSLSIASENYPREQGARECLLMPGPAMLDGTPAESGTQKALRVENSSGIYGNGEAHFEFQLNPGTPTIAPESTEGVADFNWTSTARLAREQGETGIIQGAAQVTAASPEDGAAGGPLLSVAREVSEETLGTGTRAQADTLTRRLMDRVAAIVRDPALPVPLFALGLLIAAVLGMGHALSPGHGKTVMAAYLIGERGTVWHALILGVVVTLTHTWSVIFLGLVTLYFKDYLSEDQVNFWTGILSGLIIVAIGVVLFRRRYHQYLATVQGRPGDWRFFHGHDHALEEGAALPLRDDAQPSYRNILWLGISGGVVPCPAALIVLLLALKVGRLAYGLALIVAFSLGLALVLVTIGILVVRASRLLRNDSLRESGLLQALPLGSAALITMLGAWVVVWTLLQFQVLQFG